MHKYFFDFDFFILQGAESHKIVVFILLDMLTYNKPFKLIFGY